MRILWPRPRAIFYFLITPLSQKSSDRKEKKRRAKKEIRIKGVKKIEEWIV